ncbi:hypothetical protein LGL55_09980 [Clostridium tagluense]|uniref:hypothetical protein n=1 Tax=Clostridium tagluense TaxID=360422 RepID=UPI001CF3CD6C|nr:hypothetical protein [Clostridium tagluense]MCB2321157.1 hypothetical protein [Clostridium tagluense]MCB2335755.1 hypothetical protein [Clostridium tagluense]MCB2364548.1 hypothetical protein [Clostridium tagluense]
MFIKDTIDILIVHLKNIFKVIANEKNIKLNIILLLNKNEFNIISEKLKEL